VRKLLHAGAQMFAQLCTLLLLIFIVFVPFGAQNTSHLPGGWHDYSVGL
jgi:hypothetical protein